MAASSISFVAFTPSPPCAPYPSSMQLHSTFPLIRLQTAGSKRRISITRAAMQSDQSATFEKCKEIVAEQLGIDASTVKPESKFSELGADSLDTVEIVMALEEKFKIQVEQEGAEKIITVKDASDVIHKLVSQKQAA